MSQTIEVLIRVRPGGASSDTVVVDEGQAKVCVPRLKSKGQAEFTFTRVFGPGADQKEVYAGCDVTQHILDGVSCCVMTYGQTNTGKTYTMYGNGWDDVSAPTKADGNSLRNSSSNPLQALNEESADSGDEASVTTVTELTSGNNAGGSAKGSVLPLNMETLGIVPRCISDLFEALEQKVASSKNCDYTVSK